MIWQMETASPWAPKPAPPNSLREYLAIRLLLQRHALQHLQETLWHHRTTTHSKTRIDSHAQELDCRAFTVFQIAQYRGWLPHQLFTSNASEWRSLLLELESFGSLERRRVFQTAYERSYRVQALDALAQHTSQNKNIAQRKIAKFQVITCIDDREESFRRHLEEVEPSCATFGMAGFFAVAMYYKGAAEAHFRPLCPINIVPKHFVCEEPTFSAASENDRRMQRRRILGRVSHQVHSGSRTILGGVITGLLGSLATFPLVARVLAPHVTSRIRNSIGGFVRPPATELHIERAGSEPGPSWDSLGFSTTEMANIVIRMLQDIGLVESFAPLVLILGHGSSSLNNPHESAYNCGACSGGRGGPNARAFAGMANDPRVRALVAERGIVIPEEVRFVGGYHNTCNDKVEYFDLDKLPWKLRERFCEAESAIDQARALNALERSRRFESASLNMTASEAIRHVEERSEDLSQARPEYNHATNAMVLVGRREWSRGLFMDRRAFLASYDPSIDDEQGKIVERILQAVIPVCGGISLEYYFSTVDPEGYGCGSKLPHNIASLAGVMTGAASDLRPGLSAQMVEIHEPMRILFVVQTSSRNMLRIIQANPAIRSLVEGSWVQVAVIQPDSSQIEVFNDGAFHPYVPTTCQLSEASNSVEWFRGKRDHLPFAMISLTKESYEPTAVSTSEMPSRTRASSLR
jgi:uncharacterized protein